MSGVKHDVKFLSLKTIIGFDGNAPKSLWVHPDGEHIVYPFGIKVAIYSLNRYEPQYLEGHSNVISTVALSKSGKYVGSGQINHMGFKALVFVWDWETKKPVLFHESHKVRVESVAFTSCENYVISLGGRDDANVVVYDLTTNEAICGTFSSNRNAGDALTLAALNLRGICFLSGGVYTLKVWTLNPKNRAVSSIDVTLRKIKRKINCITVDDDDIFAWCGTTTGDIMKVKLNFSKDLNDYFPVFPPTLVACYAKHPKGKGNPNNVTLWHSGVRCLILLGDKKLIGAGDGTIELVEEKEAVCDTMNKTSKLSTPTYPLFKVIKHAEVGSFVTSMQLQGKNNVLIGTIKCEMFIMDLDEFKPKLVISCHTSTIFDIAFPASYSHVFATASKDDVRVWSIDQSKELLRITVPNFTCSNVLFSHDGKAIWTSWNDGNIRAFTPQTGKLITTIFDAHNKGVSAIAATKDGKKLLSGGIEGQIRIWELKGIYQKLTAVLKEHKGPVSSIDIAPSDLEAASASTDGTCIIWDIQKCVRIAILFSQTLFMGVKYHPSGCQLLTCGTNRQIGYWEIFDGSLIREVEGSISAALNTLYVSHDGNFYITGGNDYYVKVWLYKEGITTHIGLGHAAVITAAAIAPDCGHIVSCSADGAIFIWKSPYSALPIVEAEEAKKEKEETIGGISQEQSVKAVSQPTEDSTKPVNKSPEGSKIKTPPTEGSVKCYCKGECDCRSNQPPQSPKSRLEILPSSCDNYAKDLVFLSQSAMQLCGFSIGYPVLVETSWYTTVLKAWPTNEGSLTSVRLCVEEMEIRSGLKLDSNRVKVSKLLMKPFIANEVYFNIIPVNDNDIPNFEPEIPLLSYRFKDKLLHTNMFLIIPFYGKKVKIKINKINHIEEDIAYSFQQMNLNNVFYTITENTIWINEAIDKEIKNKESTSWKIGGYDSLINELTHNILYTLNQKFTGKEQSCSPYCVLLYGPSGSGKSYIAKYLSNISQKPSINIQASELFSKFYGETENRLRTVFQEIKSKSVPSVVIIDNIETLGSKKGNDQERRVLSTLLSLFDSIRFLPVVIIATTVDPDLLDPALRRPGRLETEVEINIPNKVDRFKILKSLIPDIDLQSKLEDIAEHCHGYVAADLVSLVDKAFSKALMTTSERNISAEDLMWAFTQVRPSAMRELQVHVPAVKWNDIGGGQEVRLKLEQAVEWPLKHGESLKRLGIKAPKGVLLYGPPGCSKTLVAKALATETNLNFISIKGSDIFSKWVGESEKALRDLFRSARKVAPAIIFLDEIDALGANRGSSTGNTVHERVLSQLLTEMDGVNPLDGVVIVAATNRPDCIDKALLRPGRLDRLIYVPLPNYETRLQILKIQFEKIPTRDVLIEEIAKRTDGYSGAEVVAVCTEAALAALQEEMDADYVQMSHFESALSSVTARTPQSLLNLYEDYRKKLITCK